MIDIRTEHSVNTIGSYLIVFGGYEGQKLHNDIKVYNLNSRLWMSSNIHGLSPSHRYAHGSVVINSELYIFGGMDKQQPLNDLWRYSIDLDTWTKISYSGIISPLFRVSIVRLKGGFLIVGGCKEYQVNYDETQKYTNNQYVFNIESMSMKKLASSSANFSPRCNTKVYVFYYSVDIIE